MVLSDVFPLVPEMCVTGERVLRGSERRSRRPPGKVRPVHQVWPIRQAHPQSPPRWAGNRPVITAHLLRRSVWFTVGASRTVSRFET